MSYLKKGKVEDNINFFKKYTWKVESNGKTKYFNCDKCYNGSVEEELKKIFDKVTAMTSDEKEKIKLLEGF